MAPKNPIKMNKLVELFEACMDGLDGYESEREASSLERYWKMDVINTARQGGSVDRPTLVSWLTAVVDGIDGLVSEGIGLDRYWDVSKVNEARRALRQEGGKA